MQNDIIPGPNNNNQPEVTPPVESDASLAPAFDMEQTNQVEVPPQSMSQPSMVSETSQPQAPVSNTTSSMPVPNVIPSDPQNQLNESMPVMPMMDAGLVPPKKSKKKLVIGSIITILLFLLVGGSAAAYNVWYQNPDKVVGDGLLSVLDSKTGTANLTATVDSKDYGLKITTDSKTAKDASSADVSATLTMKSGDLANKSFSVKVSSIVTKDGVIYVKVADLEKALSGALDSYVKVQVKAQVTRADELEWVQTGEHMTDAQKKQLESQLTTQATVAAKQQIEPIIKKLDNQWIKIDMKDISKQAGDAQKCYTDAYDKLQNDKTVRSDLIKTYSKDPFVVIKDKLGSKNGSLGYLINLDETKAKQFATDFKDTDFAKNVTKCVKDAGGTDTSSSDNMTSNSNNPLKDGRVEIWVDRWSHKLTAVHFEATTSESTGDVKISGDYKLQLGAPATVDIPTNVKTIDDLKKDFGLSEDTTISGGSALPLSL